MESVPPSSIGSWRNGHWNFSCGCLRPYPLVNKQLDPGNGLVWMETKLPTPMSARVELLIYQRVIFHQPKFMIWSLNIPWIHFSRGWPSCEQHRTAQRPLVFLLCQVHKIQQTAQQHGDSFTCRLQKWEWYGQVSWIKKRFWWWPPFSPRDFRRD